MKLKTLKDIEKSEKDYDFVFSLELKQEAIKWVKEMENYELINWEENFKEFHNITKEDLE